MSNPIPFGSHVIVWGRPDEKTILLFGEGTYEADTHIHGKACPTIRLSNGREVTLHYKDVWVAPAASVRTTCEVFKREHNGLVLEWDLERYLRGERPVSASGVPVGAPAPKTSSDKVGYLKAEIDVEQNKIALYRKLIVDGEAKIKTKKDEIKRLTTDVLKEIAAVDPDFLDSLAAQLEARKAGGAVTIEPPPLAPPPQVQAIAITVRPPVADEASERDHTALAVED
jgi:hypothetical protein